MSHVPATSPGPAPAPAPVGPQDHAAARRESFLFQDGVMLCSIVRALDRTGRLDTLYPRRADDNGYLRVAWRCLAAAGWLTTDDVGATWTLVARAALRHRDRIVAAGELLARFDSTDPHTWSRPWDRVTHLDLIAAVERHLVWRAEVTDDVLRSQVDGALAVPLLLALRGQGLLEAPAGQPLRLLCALGHTNADGVWTTSGLALRRFVDHLGMVGSYLPMLARLEELVDGEVVIDPGAGEWHCERRLNVEASSAAHERYFRDADHVIEEIVRSPEPPAFVADMGCGDGSWLAHLHERLGDRVRYVAVDVSPVALESARRTLLAAGVPDPVIVLGEIGDPDGLRDTLAEHGLAMEDGLHIRSFIDHDRLHQGTLDSPLAPGMASGAYVGPGGEHLPASVVESDFIDLLERWAPHVHRHGLVILEAHCVAPAVARRHIGHLHSVAFDAYHGFSHQYPLEYQSFLRCTQAAGYEQSTHLELRYPRQRPFVAVSLNRFRPVGEALGEVEADEAASAPREDTWTPPADVDLEDGRRLHELLYVDGDLRRRRGWAAGATGEVVRDTVRAVEARVEGLAPGDRVRVLDYGAGTGLVSLELVRALRERRVLEAVRARGADVELHVVDLPGPWLAQGHALLRDVPWTRVHALRDDDGRFRPLREVTGGEPVDVVMANMVFHLLDARALGLAARSVADVLRPGGVLAFSAPDLAPALPGSLLFHDPNRMLRGLWLQALEDPGSATGATRRAALEVTAEQRAAGGVRAAKRVLPEPRTVSDVHDALSRHLVGHPRRRTDELLAEENLLTLLVPQNNRELLPEIEDAHLRVQVVRELLAERVHPELMGGPAGTAHGFAVSWTTGCYRAP